MPSVWQSTNQKTGETHALWKFYYINHKGKRKYGTGTKNYEETFKLATLLEDEHREMKLGLRLTPAENKVSSKFSDVRDEYLEWGSAQGGHHGFPWGKEHARKKKSQLIFWEKKLSLQTLSDLLGILTKVEKILRSMLTDGKSGKTINNYSEAIDSFCQWCCKRDYLPENPLKHLQRVSNQTENIRRAMTLDEISKLFSICSPDRKFLYLIALTTGLRASELASLTSKHIDLKNNGIILEAQWTKNRKSGFMGLPDTIMKQLQAISNTQSPNTPLLNVPNDTARAMKNDLKKAGIPKKTEEGKLDFHALRTTNITLVIESGATPKEAQVLARHSTIELTMNTYARTRQHRLNEITENVVNAIEGI